MTIARTSNDRFADPVGYAAVEGTETRFTRWSRDRPNQTASGTGVDDDRESPTYPIMSSSRNMEAEVAFCDPHIALVRSKREFPELERMQSKPVDSAHDLRIGGSGRRAYQEGGCEALGVPVIDSRSVVPRSIAGLFRA